MINSTSLKYKRGDLVYIQEWDRELEPGIVIGTHIEFEDGDPPGPMEVIYFEVLLSNGESGLYEQSLLYPIE